MMVLRIAFLLSGLAVAAGDRVIPHITSSDDFTTQIFLSNHSDQQEAYTLSGFDRQGVAVGEIHGFMEPNDVFGDLPIEPPLFRKRPAYLVFCGADLIKLSVAYEAVLGPASPAHVPATDTLSKSWRLSAGNWDLIWDGLAMVNMGAATAEITIRQVWLNGATLQATTLNLEAGHHTTFVLNSAFTPNELSYFIIEADKPLAMTALRGDAGSTFLWGNDLQAIDPEDAKASYSVTFQSTWSSATHPTDFPGNAHFSGLIGATHQGQWLPWREGSPASAGMEAMAETGSKSSLCAEIAEAIGEGTAEYLLSGGGLGTSPGSVSLSFEVSHSHPLVSLVSMLAPSPDWFVGVGGLNLWQNGAFVDRLEVPLYLFDSGTDSGTSYQAANQNTTPPETIHRFVAQPFLMDHQVPPIGSFTFVRTDNH